jgi:hypothetical protein
MFRVFSLARRLLTDRLTPPPPPRAYILLKANRRKLAATLDQVLGSGKVALRKVVDKAGPVRTNRINSSTILLRVL